VIPSQSGDFAGKKSIFDVSRQKSRKQAQLAYHYTNATSISRYSRAVLRVIGGPTLLIILYIYIPYITIIVPIVYKAIITA
jgi:hypothetical protein